MKSESGDVKLSDKDLKFKVSESTWDWISSLSAGRRAGCAGRGAVCEAGCGEGPEGVRGGVDTEVFQQEDDSLDFRDLR